MYGCCRGGNTARHRSDRAGNSERGCSGHRRQHVEHCTASSSHPAGGTVRGWQQRRPTVCWPH